MLEEKVPKHILPKWSRKNGDYSIPWDPKKYKISQKQNKSKANGSWKLSSSQLSERIEDIDVSFWEVFSLNLPNPPPKDAIGTTRMTTYIFWGDPHIWQVVNNHGLVSHRSRATFPFQMAIKMAYRGYEVLTSPGMILHVLPKEALTAKNHQKKNAPETKFGLFGL